MYAHVYICFVLYLYALCLFCCGYNCNRGITSDQKFYTLSFRTGKKALLTAIHGNLKNEDNL